MPYNLTYSILAIFIPGALTCMSMLFLVDKFLLDLNSILKDFPLLSNGILILISILLGTCFEISSSNKEIEFDKRREAEYEVENYWYEYLSSELVNNDMIAFRYLSGLRRIMYFELGISKALFPACVALAAFMYEVFPSAVIMICFICSILFYFLYEAFLEYAEDTHALMCRTRKQVFSKKVSANSSVSAFNFRAVRKS